MWKKLLDYFGHLLALAEATRQNKAEIKEIRQELKDLTAAVQRLAFELRSARESQQHGMETLVLRLENELLRFERRLPAPKHGKEGKP